jgi:hypothetical protein
MARTHVGNSTSGSREERGAKGRGRASAAPKEDTPTTGNAIESSSLRPVTLPAPTPIQRPTPAEVPTTSAEVEPVDRQEEIARAAYYRAEQRGFAPGFDVDDWLEAEREILEKEGAKAIG